MLNDMIKAASPAEVDSYLQELSLDDLHQALTAADASGKLPIHHAIDTCSIEMVKVLLGFDVRIDSEYQGLNVEAYAKTVSEDNDTAKQIYALIKSRGRWQADAERSQGVSVSRTIRSIEKALTNIEGAQGKVGIPFLGITGEGKSTLINFLSGVDYKKKRLRGVKSVVPVDASANEVAKVGSSTTSETYLPQVVQLAEHDSIVIDLPGFEDTRGTAEEICAAASICMLMKQLSSIQAALVVSSWSSLEDSRMVAYRKTAYNVGAMISKDPSAAENVVLVITKPDNDLTTEDIRERLEFLATEEGWDRTSNPAELTREQMSPDIWRKHCLKLATEAVLANPNGIILADVTNNTARQAFWQYIDTLQSNTKSPSQFDFVNYSRFMGQFQLVIEDMLTKYNELARNKNTVLQKVTGLKSAISELEGHRDELKATLEKFQEQSEEPFTAESFDEAITEQKRIRDELQVALTISQSKKRRVDRELMTKQSRLSGISEDNLQLIHTIDNNWVCEHTESRTETNVTERELVQLANGGWGRRVEINKNEVSGKDIGVSEPVNYTSLVPIQAIVDHSTGGNFSANGFSAGAMNIQGQFTSLPNLHGAAALHLELHGRLADFPEQRDRMNQLKQDVKAAEDALETLEQEQVTEMEVLLASQRIGELESQKLLAIGNTEQTKALCELQVNSIRPQLDEYNNKISEIVEQIDRLTEEQNDLSLQLNVNIDLFSKLLHVVETLELESDVINNFKEMFTLGVAAQESQVEAQNDEERHAQDDARGQIQNAAQPYSGSDSVPEGWVDVAEGAAETKEDSPCRSSGNKAPARSVSFATARQVFSFAPSTEEESLQQDVKMPAHSR